MHTYIRFADALSAWVAKAFAWCLMVMTLGVTYEVFVRYVVKRPTVWAFDISYMMYGTMFMLAGAYTLSRDAHVRADIFYRLMSRARRRRWSSSSISSSSFPAILALVFAGWKYASRSWRYHEVSINSPAGIPIFQFKTVIVVAGVLLVHPGHRPGHALHHLPQQGAWPPPPRDVEELEKLLVRAEEPRRPGQAARRWTSSRPDCRERQRGSRR